MALALTSCSPSEVPFDGGYQITIFGTFVPGNSHKIYVGLYGDPAQDHVCYAGAGQGNTVLAKDSRLIQAWTPALYAGGPFRVTVVDETAVEQVYLDAALTFQVASYRLTQYALRSVLPYLYRTGYRALNQIPSLP